MSNCKNGHPLTNTTTTVNAQGHTICIICRRESKRRFYKLHREQMKQERDDLQFGGNREFVIQRDGEKCVVCGMTRKEHIEKYNRDITVDHIDGNGRYKTYHLKNNAMENLQTMCLECHSRKDSLIARNK